jgi:hypothetical protein
MVLAPHRATKAAAVKTAVSPRGRDIEGVPADLVEGVPAELVEANGASVVPTEHSANDAA